MIVLSMQKKKKKLEIEAVGSYFLNFLLWSKQTNVLKVKIQLLVFVNIVKNNLE